MQGPENGSRVAAGLILIGAIAAIGLSIPRHASMPLFMAWFSSFFAYAWFCWRPPSFSTVLLVGIFVRLLLFAGMPSLSDDVYRFLWDGYLTAGGLSPYGALPEPMVGSVPGLTPELLERLNSPAYYSVYPPLNQLLFWAATALGGDNWLLSANLLRFVLLLADVGSFFLLRALLTHSGKNAALANWLFLNPLLILEATGNLHFEGLVLFFLLLALYALTQNRFAVGGVALGLAAATKLLPLIFLPAVFFQKNLKNGLISSGFALVVAGVFIAPMLLSPALTPGGLGLYFQKFEFNASFYFLFREVGFWWKGYNIIGTLGPALSMLTVLSILLIAILSWRKQWPLAQTMLFTLTTYLLLATTVHPWYILPLITLGILSGYYFPIVWSFFIFLTYLGYYPGGFELSAGWIVLEYAAISLFFGWEHYRKNHAHLF